MEREMIDYFPRVLRDYREVKGIADGQQFLFTLLWKETERVLLNQYIDTADEIGISRWEKILKIRPKGTDSLEERRFQVKTKYNQGQLPYTYRSLQRYLASVSEDFETRLNFGAYSLWLRVRLEGYRQRDELFSTLRGMIPANLTMFMQTQIPQQIKQPQLTVGMAMRTSVRHKHKGV